MSTTDRLKTDLTAAMKDRDNLRVKTLRALLSIIDNASAVPVVSDRFEPKQGLSHDVPRRQVTDEEIVASLRAERDDLLEAADEMRRHGQSERAIELERRAEIVADYL